MSEDYFELAYSFRMGMNPYKEYIKEAVREALAEERENNNMENVITRQKVEEILRQDDERIKNIVREVLAEEREIKS